MAFALNTQRLTGNGQATFDFSSLGQGNISAFIYGIQQVYIQNGSAGAQLQNFGMTYSVASDTGVGYPSVTLYQQVSNGMNVDECWADITVLAYLGGSDPQGIFMTNGSAINTGSAGTPIATSYAPVVSTAVLGGFDLNFASDSSDLLGIGAGAGVAFAPNGSGPAIAAVASGALIGDSAFSGTVDAGLIAFTSTQSTLSLIPVSTLSASSGVSQTISGVTSAAVFIQSFYAQFNIDTNPSPDLVSLLVGVENLGVSGDTVSGTANVTYSGQVRAPYTPYGGGGPFAAGVQNTALTYLVVGVTS